MMERRVGIADIVVSTQQADSLVAIGIGSCVAVVMLGRSPSGRCVAGFAHVLLPQPRESEAAASGPPGKFARQAVGSLSRSLRAKGAVADSLLAVLVGGARMFDFGNRVDVGARNVAATQDELQRIGVPVVASAVGGSRGRTLRVNVGDGTVVVRETRQPERVLFSHQMPTVTMRKAR